MSHAPSCPRVAVAPSESVQTAREVIRSHAVGLSVGRPGLRAGEWPISDRAVDRVFVDGHEMANDPVRRPRTQRLPRQGNAADIPSVSYPARVIVVDQHDIPRAGLRGVMSGLPELEVVTEATSGPQAVALCQ